MMAYSMTSTGLESLVFIPGQSTLPHFVKPITCDHRCSLCKQVLIVPVSTECGHRFCKQCMDEYRKTYNNAGSVPCPVGDSDCASMTRLYPDFPTKREIQMLLVYCENKENGCPEQMPWANLARHLKECKYDFVMCKYHKEGCDRKLPSSEIAQHEILCQFRASDCRYCGDLIPHVQLQAHMETTCPKAPINCEYKCGTTVPRDAINDHIAVCVMAPRECSFLGCEFRGRASELEQHLAQDSVKHLTLINTKILKNSGDIHQLQTDLEARPTTSGDTDIFTIPLEEMRTKIDSLEHVINATRREKDELCEEVIKLSAQHLDEKEHSQILIKQCSEENRTLKRENDELRSTVSKLFQEIKILKDKIDPNFVDPMEKVFDGVLVWKIKGYEKLKRDAVIGSKTHIYSVPFYSSRFGYKMCARLYPNGDGMGKGSHASLFFALMKGEYDALLTWPFAKKIMFTLEDQTNPAKSYKDGFISDPRSSSFHQPSREMNIATGCPLFIRQVELESERFLKDDTIYIKIEVLDQ